MKAAIIVVAILAVAYFWFRKKAGEAQQQNAIDVRKTAAAFLQGKPSPNLDPVAQLRIATSTTGFRNPTGSG